MLELISDEMKMSEAILIKIDKSCFSNNLNSVVLCDIIKDQVFPNTLQDVIVE